MATTKQIQTKPLTKLYRQIGRLNLNIKITNNTCVQKRKHKLKEKTIAKMQKKFSVHNKYQ